MKFYNWIGKIEVNVAKYCLLIMTGLVFCAAMSRKFGHPFSWAVDVSTFLFAWAVFLGVDAAMRKNSMVSVDILVKNLSPRIQWLIMCINNIIISVFLIMMVYYGVMLSISTYYRKFSGLPWLSYTWVTISVPLGCLLMLVTTILKTKDLIKKRWTS
jgi:TRAP-type C4-dicarboxylate transport system permease small subunit